MKNQLLVKKTTDENQERTLLEKSMRGDRQAFEELVHAHRDRLFFGILQIVGDEEEARDLSQEVFIRVFKNLNRFDLRRPFYPWIYRIARNLSIDYLKKHGIQRKVSLDFLEDEKNQQFESTDAMHHQTVHVRDAIYQQQIREGIRRGLEKLKPEFREVIMMKHLQEMNYEEISIALKIPAGTVMSRLFHARKALAQELSMLGLDKDFARTREAELHHGV